MPVLSENPRHIHEGYKEAVVDSLLNNLSGRLEGKGEFYKIIYGMKPSTALMSGFIVPMPQDERVGDEEADPIRISAHGMDLQILTSDAGETLTVSVRGAVYVRILPTVDEIKPGGRLEPVFPLNAEARTLLRTKVREALVKLEASLPGGKKHESWRPESLAVRRQAYIELGLPFDNKLDRATVEGSDSAIEVEHDNDLQETDDGTPIPAQAASATMLIPDGMAEPIAPPAKWLRLELTLPSFEFTPTTAEADATKASAILNAAIREQLHAWAASGDEFFGGQLWGYRHGQTIRPSDLQNWTKYLEAVRASKLKLVLPDIELRWVVQALQDPLDASRNTLHVALENWSTPPSKTNHKEVEPSVFQLVVSVTLPAKIHQFLRMDRVKPSYRYNRYLKYPALGFNGGVAMAQDGDVHTLTTTWSPRYVLPRIVPVAHGVDLNIARLSQPDCLERLAPLLPAYEKWLEVTALRPVGKGLEGPKAAEQQQAEEAQLQQDLLEWKAELGAIRSGLAILEESRKHWSGPGPQKSRLGIPFEAWVSMNAAMAKVAAGKGYDEWRLFQLAFILASIPAFATRIREFHDFYTPEVAKHANAVTLLYFSTGGGKSEAFLGLLVFVLLLDRLRGKLRGVSALMRYPLRLLTLQQARRTLTAMAAAEDERYHRGHPGEPFSLGFWVGGSNTPNWHTTDGYTDVDTVQDVSPSGEVAHRETQPYKSARERWLKLSSCPFCGSKSGSTLALRRKPGAGGNALGHYCTAPKAKCSWNERFDEPTPLPFYIVDEDIYDLAPSVLLGTVDKLSALGQSQGTIRKFFGMFGFAPFVETATGRLFVPTLSRDWEGRPDAATKALFPTYENGEKLFFDPFPSLLIQDEAHLLDESLGTFSGLFESALEAGFDQLAHLYKGELAYEPDSNERRRIKVIAASATVSEPQRQMRNIYQRQNTVRFPYPGPDLYSSFYAAPKQPDDTLNDQDRASISESETELRSRWARVYGSILTNGHRHTVAMASVLGHYHLAITSLYERLKSEDVARQDSAREELVRWVSPGPLQTQFTRLLETADPAVLLTLVDLHRIALTYVTNKKGGDQVIDTEKTQFEKLHEAAGIEGQVLASELISGAVSAADIQEVVRRAETRVGVNKEFPDLNDTLRSVIATSAISHGVDVEEFNAMFFAGLPSDIAEYIQASSRVGRTHVGFSLLVPVPQRYRDRFVLEIHDIFHRFLERMILPAAVDRWAEKALVRVMPSFFQEYVCGINVIEALCAANDPAKRYVPTCSMAADARAYMSSPVNVKATEAFMEKALGLQFMPSPEGKKYYKALLKGQLNHYRQDLDVDKYVNSTRLVKFFEMRDARLRPMTSLRDVDQPGFIRESGIDAASKRVAPGATARAMTFIRKGSGADIDVTDPETEAKS